MINEMATSYSQTPSNNNDEDPNSDVTEEELRSKLKEYINFIDHILQPELEQAVANREEIEFQIQEYDELKMHVQNFIRSNERKQKEADGCGMVTETALVDLGCQLVFCSATINDPNKIFVDDGEGNHVGLTLEQSLPFIDKRIKYLETQVLPSRIEKAKTVASHLEESLTLLETIGKEIQSSSKNQ